jgi:hypothetical protein
MAKTTFVDEVVLVTETCCECGTVFAMERTLNKNCHRIGKKQMFYCPNGHGQYYTQSTEAKIKELQEQLERAQNNSRWWKGEAEAKARSLAATKGVLTKTKKRIQNGVCPCCNRSFENLARHMHNQHPEYAQEEE